MFLPELPFTGLGFVMTSLLFAMGFSAALISVLSFVISAK
jgi:hypothetical protein